MNIDPDTDMRLTQMTEDERAIEKQRLMESLKHEYFAKITEGTRNEIHDTSPDMDVFVRDYLIEDELFTYFTGEHGTINYRKDNGIVCVRFNHAPRQDYMIRGEDIRDSGFPFYKILGEILKADRNNRLTMEVVKVFVGYLNERLDKYIEDSIE